jgi:hypothetical protein
MIKTDKGVGTRKPPGRPSKFGQGRVTATVRFTPERYAELKQAATDHGRSVSEQVEVMIERVYTIEATLAALRTDVPTLERGVFRRNHVPVHSPHGDIWIPKGHPDAPKQGGFIPKGRQK